MVMTHTNIFLVVKKGQIKIKALFLTMILCEKYKIMQTIT